MQNNTQSQIEAVSQSTYTSNKHIVRDYFLTILVIITATSSFFGGAKWFSMMIFSIFAIMHFSKKGFSLDKKMINVLAIVVAMISLQGLLFGFKLLTLFTYVAGVILLPYFIFTTIGIKFLRYLVNVVYFVAVYTFFLWLAQILSREFSRSMQQLAIDVFNIVRLDSWPRSILFYTVSFNKESFLGMDFYRNCGIFHEPGAYAHWLVFCIGLNSIFQRKYINRKNIIMSIILITTFSTTGYLMLFMLLVYWIGIFGRNRLLNIILIGIFVYLSYYTFNTTDFLGKKINDQLDNYGTGSLEGRYSTGRILPIRKALSMIAKNPITGRGIISASAEMDKRSSEYIGTASLGVIAKYGVIFGVLYWLFLYRGIRRLIYYHGGKQVYANFFFAAIVLGGLSQIFFFDAITFQLFLFGLLVKVPHMTPRNTIESSA